MVRFLRIALCVLAALVPKAAVADSTRDLAQWRDWVEQGHPEIACPWLATGSAQHQCIWPGRLVVDVSSVGARFSLDVEVFGKETLVELPGDRRHWPQRVTLGSESAIVVERGGLPHVQLASGQHRLEGRFGWSSAPSSLRVPASMALVTLTRDGEAAVADRRGDQLLLSAGSDSPVARGQDALDVEVFRLLEDGIPMVLETRIRLTVSGRSRELTVGRAVPPGSPLLDFSADIPARLEDGGLIRAQVGPGEHELRLRVRLEGNPSELSIVAPVSEDWPDTEYLSTRSEPGFRQLRITGAPSVDTSQLRLPPEWAELPTFRLTTDSTLSLAELTRGDQAPAANEFNIQRDIWLDFDGQGLTTLDRVNGRMGHGWRLDAAPGSSIGRASVGGQPVLITRYQDREGIEIRRPAIELEAVTRWPSINALPAVGWDAQAESWKADLHLPPGWRLLHAAGADKVNGTWLSRWDLWDVFLVLVIIAASRKLFGNREAVLAGVAYLLAYQEIVNPLQTLPLLLVIVALLPLGLKWMQPMLRLLGGVIAVAVVMVFLGFAVESFRLAIYPSLERAQVGDYQVGRYASDRSAPAIAELAMETSAMAPVADEMMVGKARVRSPGIVPPRPGMLQPPVDQRVQTGPGLPTWTWNKATLKSTAPMPGDQQLELYYSSPWMTALWRVAMVLFSGWYIALVLRRLVQLMLNAGPDSPGDGATVARGTLAVFLAGLLIAVPEPASAQTNSPQAYPPAFLLTELEARMTRAPDCLPGCVSINNARIELDGSVLQMTAELNAAAAVAVPLPSASTHLEWGAITLNGRPVALARDGDAMLMAVRRGVAQLHLSANINGDQAALGFPVAFHNLQVNAPGWQIGGLVDGRVVDRNLTLTRAQQGSGARDDTLRPDPAPPFVRIIRQFVIGEVWRIQTTVIREAPRQGALPVAVPLLAGEQLLTEVGSVVDDVLQVQLAPGQRQLSWWSGMEPVASLLLEADSQRPLVEEWRFEPSERWRLSFDGLQPLKQAGMDANLDVRFKPWPGEQLQIQAVQPEGVAGPVVTVEGATLDHVAGDRLQKSTLEIQLRASLGEDFHLALPDDAEILALSYGGQSLNIPNGNEVVVPLRPGLHALKVEFQQAAEAGMLHVSPVVGLPDGGSNLRVHYTLPHDRWPLYISGPSIGPAMLYWGVLCVILLGGVVLYRLARHLELPMPISLGGWVLLGLGLSTVNSYGVLIVAVFFFALSARARFIDPAALTRNGFNLIQVGLVLLSVVAALSLLSAIPQGLLADPEMRVVGNASHSHLYRYYQDMASADAFPVVSVISVPLMAYRLVMLLWSLWLATRLLAWARWGWECYSTGASWRPGPPGHKKRPDNKKSDDSGPALIAQNDEDAGKH